MHTVARAALAGVLAIGFTANALADSIQRRGQQNPTTGDITEISKTGVTIKPRTRDAEKIPANEIIRIRWENEPIKLNPARGFEERGLLTNAMENYLAAQTESKSDDANLKTEIEYLIARTTARMALADPARTDEAIQKLQAFQKGHPDNFRFFESLYWLGRVQMAKDDHSAAKGTFDQMAQAPWTDYKMAAQIGAARVLLEQQQYDAARQAFEAAIAMPGDGPAEVSRRQEAQLGKATALQKQQQHDEAIEVLDEVIQQVAPEDGAIQAEAYVRQGDSLQALGKTKEALLAYLHVDVLFPGETALHAESLFQLARLWNTVGQPGRAGEAVAKLQSDYPNSEWTKKLAGGE